MQLARVAGGAITDTQGKSSWLVSDIRGHDLSNSQADSPSFDNVRSGIVPAMSTTELGHHHATVFLDPERNGPVEELRSRWDPRMASQIAAHITLIYPEEIPDPAELDQLAETAAANTPPFSITLGPAFYVGSPADGVFFRVHDIDDGIGSFRARTVPPDRAISFPPHVTIVHPRTSCLGGQAWRTLATTQLDVQSAVTHVTITASDGDQWHTVRRLPLTGRRDRRRRARCVPDRPVNAGELRSLPDSPIHRLTCGQAV